MSGGRRAGPETPPWAQDGVTCVESAERFLACLRADDTLVLATSDTDRGYGVDPATQHLRARNAYPGASCIMATPPAPDLLAYHHALGLGPRRIYCPRAPVAERSLAELVASDAELCRRIGEAGMRRCVVGFKDEATAALLARLGLEAAYCGPMPAAYELANDKHGFATAAAAYGYDAVPLELAADANDAEAIYRRQAPRYGAGCVVRLRRGAGGRHIYAVRSARAAGRRWRALHERGDVLIAPYVPPSRLVRNVATHGIVTADGFRPLAFTEQLQRGPAFRGGRGAVGWPADEVACLRHALDRIAAWLRDLGYVDAPAGVDGFLVRDDGRLRFLACDPNVRLTATMLPWSVIATLSERAPCRFTWAAEWTTFLGVRLDLERVRRGLGRDLLDPSALAAGGVLPTMLTSDRLGPIPRSGAWMILLARSASHLETLRRRVRRLAPLTR